MAADLPGHTASGDGALRLTLVCMPWASLEMPSLGLSVLAAMARELDAVASVAILYANILWADHYYRHTNGEIGTAEYEDIVNGYYVATGEWVFSPALYGPCEPDETPFYRAATRNGANLDAATDLFRLSPGFVDQLARWIADTGCDIVGLTSTFDQNMPSLALANAVKRLRPDVLTVMGGANCDDVQGSALHRNFPFLDFVVRGEGERAFGPFLEAVTTLHVDEEAGYAALRAIDGLCWRDACGRSVANSYHAQPVPAGLIHEPEFDAYFEAFERSQACTEIDPQIVVEGSRGCWWGEKHHCTFCGLNGSLMAFRAKDADRMLAEVKRAVERHRCLDVVFADNILDMDYVMEFLPRLGALGWDLRLFFEVKSNLTYEQLLQLAEGGVTQIQPGIESLSSRVLSIMKKGVTGWRNVRMLRDCRTLSIYPGWNLLYGFPGESEDDYWPIIEQIPNLVHLVPPEGAYRIVLTRFSPYYNDPSLGLANLGPSNLLTVVYELPTDELADLVYIFESSEAGISPALAHEVDRAVEHWSEHHQGRRLVAFDEGDALKIVDERRPDTSDVLVLDAPLHVDAYRCLLRGRSLTGLSRALAKRGHHDIEPSTLASLLAGWREQGLTFHDGTYDVALCTGLEYS